MSPAQFTDFLTKTFRNLATNSLDGAIHFVCMDWRHMSEILSAGNAVYSELKNLIVWAKDNGGMGTFYRSRHELIFVFKVGTAAHVNTFELGQHGRYRTNVWEYRGVNTLRSGRLDELEMHPTVKPVSRRIPRATLFEADAAQLRNLDIEGPVGAVVSGLPLLSMSTAEVAAILSGAFKHLARGGSFFQFTYGPRCPVARGTLILLGLEAKLVGRALLNFPPASVYRISRRQP